MPKATKDTKRAAAGRRGGKATKRSTAPKTARAKTGTRKPRAKKAATT